MNRTKSKYSNYHHEVTVIIFDDNDSEKMIASTLFFITDNSEQKHTLKSAQHDCIEQVVALQLSCEIQCMRTTETMLHELYCMNYDTRNNNVVLDFYNDLDKI